MIVVITPDENMENEFILIHQLLENGLNAFHIRKYKMDDMALKNYMSKIDERFRNHLVLHSHHHLAKESGIRRLHFNETDRIENKHLPYKHGFILSTSVHSIHSFNDLSREWDYAFLSPVFPSISKKGYGIKDSVLKAFRLRQNHSVKLVGLGGINEKNIHKMKEEGAEGAALLGSIWHSEDPLGTFIKCKNTYQLL